MFLGTGAFVESARVSSSGAALVTREEDVEEAFARLSRSVVAILSPRDTNTQYGTGMVWARDRSGRMLIATRRASLPSSIPGAPVSIRQDGEQFEAEVAGSDPGHGLAAILSQPSGSAATEAPLVRGNSLRVGQQAIGVGADRFGAPFLTLGVVSATRRDARELGAGISEGGALQVDLSYSAPGHRGGLLADSYGRVAGMLASPFGPPVSASASTGRTAGVSFAVPTDLLSSVVPRLLAYGES